MALKFLDIDKATRVALRVCPILVEVGRYNAVSIKGHRWKFTVLLE